jgi:hypothetical protein
LGKRSFPLQRFIDLDPPVVKVMRRNRAFDRKQRGNLVVLENDLAVGIDDEADVEEAVLPVLISKKPALAAGSL